MLSSRFALLIISGTGSSPPWSSAAVRSAMSVFESMHTRGCAWSHAATVCSVIF